MVENEPKNSRNYPENIKNRSKKLMDLRNSPEGSKCCWMVRTMFRESYSIGFYHFKVIPGRNMVKNEPKIAEISLKTSKTGQSNLWSSEIALKDLNVVGIIFNYFLPL